MNELRCAWCGRFVDFRTRDEFTHFGSAADYEPPDPVIICSDCSWKQEQELVRTTVRPLRIALPWRPGRCHWRAIERLGMVAAGPGMAACCEAFWPEQVPEGYKIHQNPWDKGTEADNGGEAQPNP